MSIHTLDWHKECLQNMTISTDEKRKEVARVVADLERMERNLAFYTEQIAEAEKRGMKAFDCERLLVKRKRGD